MKIDAGVWLLIGCLGLAGCSGDSSSKDGDTADPTGDDDDVAPGDDDDDTTGVELLTCADEFTPCGGDPAGDWSVSGVCNVTYDDLDCPTLVITVDADRSSGDVHMDADGTYTRVYNVDVDISAVLPKVCVGGAPCAAVPPLSGGLLSACADDGDNCNCTGTLVYTEDESGTWVQSGSQLTFDGDTVLDVCVAGTSAVTQDEAAQRVLWTR